MAESTDNWHGFCRAYSREFNISYPAAVCEAGPAWFEYKKKHGLSFKYEKKYIETPEPQPQPQPQPALRQAPHPAQEDLLRHRQLEKAKMAHRKGMKRSRGEEEQEEEEEDSDSPCDVVTDPHLECEGEEIVLPQTLPTPPQRRTVKRVPATQPPPPKKRKLAKKNHDHHEFYSQPPPYGYHGGDYPYHYPPPPPPQYPQPSQRGPPRRYATRPSPSHQCEVPYPNDYYRRAPAPGYEY